MSASVARDDFGGGARLGKKVARGDVASAFVGKRVTALGSSRADARARRRKKEASNVAGRCQSGICVRARGEGA